MFVDVHKAIRRMAPAPRTKYTKQQPLADASYGDDTDEDETEPDEETRLLAKRDTVTRKPSANGLREATVLMRRPSSSSTQERPKPVTVRSNTAELRQHLKHLGPSNVASRPKATKYTTVKIKPGVSTIPEDQPTKAVSVKDSDSRRPESIRSVHIPNVDPATEGGAGAGLLDSAGKDAKDGALALAQGYGTMGLSQKNSPDADQNDEETAVDGRPQSPKDMTAAEASAFADKHTVVPSNPETQSATQDEDREDVNENDAKADNRIDDKVDHNDNDKNDDKDKDREHPELPEKLIVEGSTSRPISRDDRRSRSASSHSDTLGEMESQPKKNRASRTARSGSITENVMHVNGMKKVVLATSSSSDTEEAKKIAQNDGADDTQAGQNGDDYDGSKGGSKKKKKKKRAGKKFHKKDGKDGSGDSTPVLAQHDD